jgi:hypothetical protein
MCKYIVTLGGHTTVRNNNIPLYTRKHAARIECSRKIGTVTLPITQALCIPTVSNFIKRDDIFVPISLKV